jgi:hypothetical protein
MTFHKTIGVESAGIARGMHNAIDFVGRAQRYAQSPGKHTVAVGRSCLANDPGPVAALVHVRGSARLVTSALRCIAADSCDGLHQLCIFQLSD